MNEIETLLSAITQIGFPIVMCLILMNYCKELINAHSNESDKVVEAINECTAMINKLLGKVDAIDKYFLQGIADAKENK